MTGKALGLRRAGVPGTPRRQRVSLGRVLAVLAGAVAVWGAAAPPAAGAGGVVPAAPAAARAAGTWGRAIGVPGLRALNEGGYAQVTSVSCASPGDCAAGGFYLDRLGRGQGFVAVEKDGRWGRAIEVPGLGALNEGGPKGGMAQVTSVSCGSAGSCAAGGFYRDGDRRQQGFVAVEKDGRWGRAIEVPGLDTLNAGGNAWVESVSCASAGSCSAGGDYRDGHRNYQGFVAVERNGRWGQAIEVPGLDTLNAGGNANVGSVSCASAANCTAAGDYRDQHRNYHGFVVSERNSRWGQAVQVPGLRALSKGGDAFVFSVSCGSAGNCAAVGEYRRQGFVAVERNGRWRKAIKVPGLRALVRIGISYVGPVSCGSAGNCAAVGGYLPRNGQWQGFMVSEKNGAWAKAINVPGLKALNTGEVSIFSVSCASAGNCAAGGFYQNHGSQGFVASEQNDRWGTAIKVPGLRALGPRGDVISVSCGSTGRCTAGGDYQDSGGNQQGFVT